MKLQFYVTLAKGDSLKFDGPHSIWNQESFQKVKSKIPTCDTPDGVPRSDYLEELLPTGSWDRQHLVEFAKALYYSINGEFLVCEDGFTPQEWSYIEGPIQNET